MTENSIPPCPIDFDTLNHMKQKGYAIGNILLAFISEFDVTQRQGIPLLFIINLQKKIKSLKENLKSMKINTKLH